MFANFPPDTRVADMLKADLDRIGIAYEDAEGRVFDFHALRGQFITDLGRSGAPQVVVQRLARHTDFKVTSRYLHIGLADEAAAVNRLPWPTPIKHEAVAATGTDGGAKEDANLASNMASAQGDSARHSLTQHGAMNKLPLSAGKSVRLIDKPLEIKGFVADRHDATQHDAANESMPAACPSGLRERIANPLASAIVGSNPTAAFGGERDMPAAGTAECHAPPQKAPCAGTMMRRAPRATLRHVCGTRKRPSIA